MAFGWYFRLGATAVGHNLYLLLGIPLVVIFQLAIARRPVTSLWVRGREPFSLDRTGIVIAVALAVVPGVAVAANRRSPILAAFFLCALVGAVPAAFAVRRQRKAGLRAGLRAFAAAIAVGATSFALSALHAGRAVTFPLSKLPLFAAQSLEMLTLGFVVEEVVFRGALDTYLAPTMTAGAPGWVSAIVVSALWGCWHLPLAHVSGARDLGAVAGHELLHQIAVGILLSLCWRRSGTLVLPSAAHAIVDAYRNMIGP
jgi:membrane protease YdiL (CAAX protease family)